MEVLELKDGSAVLHADLVREATCSAVYRLLGRTVRISGNAPEILDRFNLLYGPLEVVAPAGPIDDEIGFRLADSPKGRALTVAGRGAAFASADAAFLQWPAVVFNRVILGSVRTHLILHAGAVSREGRGLVISGNSGMGKSTLVSHLVARGFGFLSDEIAPVERGTGIIEPHPLRVGLRPGPGQALSRDAASIEFSCLGDEKRLVDMAVLSGARAAERVPLRTVIFLSTRAEGPVNTSKKVGGPVGMVVTGWPAALERDIAELSGVAIAGTRAWRENTEVLLRVDNLHTIAPSLNELAAAHGVEIVQLQYEDFGEHDFDVDPVLAPISTASAVIELVKRMPSYCRAALIRDAFGGSAARLVEEWAGLVKTGVSFYRLTPGRLDRALDLVEGVAR